VRNYGNHGGITEESRKELRNETIIKTSSSGGFNQDHGRTSVKTLNLA